MAEQWLDFRRQLGRLSNPAAALVTAQTAYFARCTPLKGGERLFCRLAGRFAERNDHYRWLK